MKKRHESLYSLKKTSPYVDGVVGADFRLSLMEKLKMLFCNGVQVILVGEDVEELRIGVE